MTYIIFFAVLQHTTEDHIPIVKRKYLEEFVQTSRRLVGVDININNDIQAINNHLFFNIIDASEYMDVVEAVSDAILYFNKQNHINALQLAIAGRNAYMFNKWLINDIPVIIGRYNKVKVYINDQDSLVGYPWLCHVGDTSIGSRAFLLDPLITMLDSLLPDVLKGCKIKITEEKESIIMSSSSVTFDITPSNNLVHPFSVNIGTIDSVFIVAGNGLTHPYFHSFFEKAYYAYTQIKARSMRINYPIFLTYCWMCHAMAKCKVCSGCGCARFCSESCRNSYWPVHKKYCNKTVSFMIQL